MDASSPPEVEAGSTPGRRRRSPYRPPVGRPPQHGAAMLTRVLRTVPLDSIDRRSAVGVALRRIREELAEQLGEASPAERILVEEIAKARVIAAAVGDWILRQESGLVREGELLPAVVQHSALVANLARMLSALKAKPPAPMTLAEYLAAKGAAMEPIRETRRGRGGMPGLRNVSSESRSTEAEVAGRSPSPPRPTRRGAAAREKEETPDGAVHRERARPSPPPPAPKRSLVPTPEERAAELAEVRAYEREFAAARRREPFF
jgi:hypothetical protein